MNCPGAIVGPSSATASNVSVQVSAVSCDRSTTRNGTGVMTPAGAGSANVAKTVDVEEAQAGRLQPVDQNLREPPHELVPEGGVGIALRAQAGAVERRRPHRRGGARVEVPV